jgi:glycosyltransferase involved in cell wall biosynthesis
MLREAVESVLGQTFADWELIVVDDGSTDDSREYVLSLHDLRVQLVSIAHSGSAAWARNTGIARARGEWIAFLDSDDLWTASKLERQLDALRAQPGCQWSCTGFSFIDENGEPTHQRSGADPLTLIREHARRTTKSLAATQLYGWNERVFRKAAKAATDRRIRSLCLRQCARQRVARARALARDGDRPGAAAAMVGASWLMTRALLKR